MLQPFLLPKGTPTPPSISRPTVNGPPDVDAPVGVLTESLARLLVGERMGWWTPHASTQPASESEGDSESLAERSLAEEGEGDVEEEGWEMPMPDPFLGEDGIDRMMRELTEGLGGGEIGEAGLGKSPEPVKVVPKPSNPVSKTEVEQPTPEVDDDAMFDDFFRFDGPADDEDEDDGSYVGDVEDSDGSESSSEIEVDGDGEMDSQLETPAPDPDPDPAPDPGLDFLNHDEQFDLGQFLATVPAVAQPISQQGTISLAPLSQGGIARVENRAGKRTVVFGGSWGL